MFERYFFIYQAQQALSIDVKVFNFLNVNSTPLILQNFRFSFLNDYSVLSSRKSKQLHFIIIFRLEFASA